MDAVVCITDRNYLVPTKVLVSTLSQHLASSVEIYVLSQDVTLADFQGHSFSHRVTGVINHSDLSIFAEVKRSRFMGKTHVTPDAMAKLQLPFMFAEHRRVLYLDVDMICCSDEINELFDLELGDALVAAVPDFKRAFDPFRSVLGIPGELPYFNSGLVLFDIAKCRTALTERLVADRVELLGDSVRFVDQDTLNHLFRGRVHYLPLKFNVFANVHMGNDVTLPLERVVASAGPDFLAYPEAEVVEALERRVVLHYTTSSKPWKTTCGHEELWWAQCDHLNLGLKRQAHGARKHVLEAMGKRAEFRLKKVLKDPQLALQRSIGKAYRSPILRRLDQLTKSQKVIERKISSRGQRIVRFPVAIDLRWATVVADLHAELQRVFEAFQFRMSCHVLLPERWQSGARELGQAWGAHFITSEAELPHGVLFFSEFFFPDESALGAEYLAHLTSDPSRCSEFGRWILHRDDGTLSILGRNDEVDVSFLRRFSEYRYDRRISALYSVRAHS